MKLLTFDTATTRCAVALCIDDEQWMSDVEAGNSHSQLLLPTVLDLLAQANMSFAKLDAIGFGIGPGSFTGVRIACACAQGLALAHGLTLLPVASLAALAYSVYQPPMKKIWAVNDARMNEVYVAGYTANAAGDLQESHQVRVCSPEAALPPDGDWVLAGDGFAAYAPLQQFAPQVLRSQLTALGLLRATQAQFVAGVRLNARDAHPHYVRDQVALTEAERAALQKNKVLLT